MALIWQSSGIYQPSYDFNILVDKDFVQKMRSAQVPSEKQKRMNELCSETLKRFNYTNHSPLIFHENSGLVTQFSLGREGRWLKIDSHTM